MRNFLQRQYATPNSADYIQMQLAVSWTESCDEGENAPANNVLYAVIFCPRFDFRWQYVQGV